MQGRANVNIPSPQCSPSLRLALQIACLTFNTDTRLNNNTAIYLGIIMLLRISCKLNVSLCVSQLSSCFRAHFSPFNRQFFSNYNKWVVAKALMDIY